MRDRTLEPICKLRAAYIPPFAKGAKDRASEHNGEADLGAVSVDATCCLNFGG